MTRAIGCLCGRLPGLGAGMLFLGLGAGSAAGQTPPTTAPASQPAATAAPEHLVLEPSQGRPKILAPGDTFYFLLRLQPGLGSTIFVDLAHSKLPTVRHALTPEAPLSVVQEQFGTLVFRVPRDAKEGLYDLQVRSEGWSYRQPHCIQVIEKYKTKFRFVHLSDMNIDDPSAPEFDSTLAEEINLLAPAFIVATGDYTEWSRLLDDPWGWPRVLEFFEEFDAPVFLVCGDHDHEASFTTYVSNNPVGSFNYGDYHGILLLDHSAHPLSADQVQWLRKDLADHRDSVFSLIVTHDDELTVLDALADREHLPAFLREHKLAMIITGGHTDWDYQEFAGKLEGLDGLHYIRTHQASTCLRDRATGVSHYRVIEVDGAKFSYVYADDTAREPAQHSIPVGRLRVFYDVANDGSQRRVMAVVQNALNQAFRNGRLWLRVAKGPGEGRRPAVAGGRLVQTFDAGNHWLCNVAFDVPDKGGTRVLVSTEGKLPESVRLSVALDGTRELKFTRQRTPFGMSYYSCPDELAVRLSNQTNAPITAWPVVRLNGNRVPIDEGHADRWPTSLEPGQTIQIPLRLALGRVSEGPHLLQVYFLEDPLKRVTTFPVTLSLATDATFDITPPRPAIDVPTSQPTTTSAPATQPAASSTQPG